MFILPFIAALIVSGACAWWRLGLRIWTLATAVAIVIVGLGLDVTTAWIVTLVVFAIITVPLNIPIVRRRYISARLLKKLAGVVPRLSDTERIALEAGTVGFEAQLFSGKPDWRVLLDQPVPQLSAEEKAFVDGPVEELCAMLDDWQITHELGDLPPQVWEFMKSRKFFGMIIPKKYGGLEFSALAHSAVLQKVASRSTTAASIVAVPNSLGPAELLLHYGSEQQKDHFLPRLADGREIPCFALTGPHAGSDATSIPDYGIVCKGEWQGGNVLGVRLTFDKRYITLAPVATIVGLAFRMHDPEHLLGDAEDVGITLALLPRDTPGLEVGRRHLPLNNPFQNGPVRGTDVFVPLSTLIGGADMAGQGWRMLVECLSVGRGISLPSNAVGGAKMAAAATGAYARLRRQFGISINHFEGVDEVLARIAGHTYAAAAVARALAAAVDRGEKPAVSSAIAKYHATEWARMVISDAMDVHGGKGIQLGPSNYLGRAWQGAPIGITVEGANIMTRSLMIFGQGAIRCHPYVLAEMRALDMAEGSDRLRAFDRALFGHVGFSISNAVRALLLGITGANIGKAPGNAHTRHAYRVLNRYSAALALCADVSMGVLGGRLKFMEKLSARLGDVLSHLFVASSMLKYHADMGRPASDRPLLDWALQNGVWEMQQALDGVIRNFPVRPAAWLLRVLVFPLGRRVVRPADELGHRAAAVLTTPSDARARLVGGASLAPSAHNVAARLNALLPDLIAADPAQRKVVKAAKTGELTALDRAGQLAQARDKDIVSDEEYDLLSRLDAAGAEFIGVDDFDGDEFKAAVARPEVAPGNLHIV